MRTDAPLKSRYREILIAIVRAYIENGEPVGSRTISKLREDALSPASIRNVMADLADEGYLSQPHTSAGRVPTDKAFQFYVASLQGQPMLSSESDRLRREFSGLDTVGRALSGRATC
jgi:heat-inducible transcriptional repressor